MNCGLSSLPSCSGFPARRRRPRLTPEAPPGWNIGGGFQLVDILPELKRIEIRFTYSQSTW